MLYLQLFWAFFQVGLFSFGGGYAAVPLIQRQIIDTYGWISLDAFADLITISEMTPGPIALNCATFVGQQVGRAADGIGGGILGACISTIGCALPSLIIVVLLSILYIKFRSLRIMQSILAGLRPAIIAMIASAGLSLLFLALFDTEWQHAALKDIRPVEAVIFVCCLFLLRAYKPGPVQIILGSGAVGFFVYYLMGR